MCSAEPTNHTVTDAKPAGKKARYDGGDKATRSPAGCKTDGRSEAMVKKSGREPVVLVAQLEIKTIASLVEQLLPVLSLDGPVVIDAAKLESVDSAALQVLVAFANSARARALALEWRGTTSVLKEFSELADLDRYLDLPVAPVEVQDDGLCPVF